MKTLIRFLIPLTLLFIVLLTGCSDNAVETIELPSVQIISPLNNSIFKKVDQIRFYSKLMSGASEIENDSVKWEFSNFTTIYKRNGFYGYVGVGEQNVLCTMYSGNESYTSNIRITVQNEFAIDTLVQDNEYNVYEFPEDRIICLGLNQYNSIMVGTESSGLFIDSENSWVNYNVTDGLIENGVQTISLDHDNKIYIGYYVAGGISRLDENGITTLFKDGPILEDIHSIIFDDNNIMWAADHNGDVFRYINGQKITFPDQDVDFHHPNDFMFDSKGNLWGSSDYGAMKYDGTEWDSIFVGSRLIRSTCMIVDKNDNAWFGYGSKLYKLNDTDTTVYGTEYFGLNDMVFLELEVDSHNNIWIGINQYLVKFDGSTYEVFSPPVGEKHIRSIIIDSNDKVWFTASLYEGTSFLLGNLKGI